MVAALGTAVIASCGVDQTGLGSMPFLPHDASSGDAGAAGAGGSTAGAAGSSGIGGASGTGGEGGSVVSGAAGNGAAGISGAAGTTAGAAGNAAGAGGSTSGAAGSTGATGGSAAGIAGNGGTTGSGGSAGTTGTGGTAGTLGGVAGTGGSATGVAGTMGAAGTSGAAGSAGTGGGAGTTGVAGIGGRGGVGAVGGIGGRGGTGGTGGMPIPCTPTTCSNGCCKDSTTCIRMRSAIQCGSNGAACTPCGGCQICSSTGQCQVDNLSRWTITAVSAQIKNGMWDRPMGEIGGALPDPFCEFENPAGNVSTTTAGVTDTIIDTLNPSWNQVITPAGMTVQASTLMANNPAWQIWVGDDDGCASPGCLADVVCTFRQPITDAQLRSGQLVINNLMSCNALTLDFTCQP